MAIVLPESVFHAPSLAYVRQFMLAENNVRAIVDLPHNTFRPHCNAKTCLLVLEKGKPQQESIIMAAPEEMGHDHSGRVLYRQSSEEVWNDLVSVSEELVSPGASENDFVFLVNQEKMDWDILVPRFYRRNRRSLKLPTDSTGIPLGTLVDEGVIGAWDGHGSPESQMKGEGDVPYIRVSDIVNWEMYRNPVTGIPLHEYERVFGPNGRKPQEGDVILVRRGSYRIGTVAMASNRDEDVLLTKELLTLRVLDKSNKYGIDQFYLLASLSSRTVQEQIPDLVFIDTTLPNLGDRWRHLIIPVPKELQAASKVAEKVRYAIEEKWSAQDRINELRSEWGGMTT